MEEKKLKIKYEVGYQLTDACFSFRDLIAEFVDYIDTVYFPWTQIATCRNAISNNKGHVNWMAQFILERDLRWLRDQGIKLNLLFNANCYGEQAVSKYLENQIQSVIEHLTMIGLRPEIVTTTSPAIARMLKKSHKDILVRASVNMRIGTVEGMQGKRNGVPGDLLILIEEEPHAELIRDENDLIYNLLLDIPTATLGGTADIPTIDSKVRVKIEPGTQPGKVLRLRGKGLPSVNGYGTGDLLVNISVYIPETLSKDEKAAMEKFQKSDNFMPNDSLKDKIFRKFKNLFD